MARASGQKPRHSNDLGSSPQCGKFFFCPSQLSVLTLFQCLYGLRVHTACINICVHVKNPKCWQPCFSPRVIFQWRLTYSLCTAPQCKLHASTLKSQTLDLWGGQKGYVLSGAHQQTLHKFIKTKSSPLSYNLSPSVALTLSFSVCLSLSQV